MSPMQWHVIASTGCTLLQACMTTHEVAAKVEDVCRSCPLDPFCRRRRERSHACGKARWCAHWDICSSEVISIRSAHGQGWHLSIECNTKVTFGQSIALVLCASCLTGCCLDEVKPLSMSLLEELCTLIRAWISLDGCCLSESLAHWR